MFLSWERSHQLSTYATGEDGGVIQNAYSRVQREGVLRLMSTYALTLFMFLAAYLSYSVLFYL